jgi:pimeloyl-ACP methyl ester carboxylesterase
MTSHTIWPAHAPTGVLANIKSHPYAAAALVAAAALAASAVVNRGLARKAERDNPPAGRFLEIDGVRLHYVERGAGDPVVLLHGNGSMVQDFETSGLMHSLAQRHRVVAFDRPGFGHSDRPRSRIWTAEAQANLLQRALAVLGIRRAIVLGHSWGASVAVALAIAHPDTVKGLVLASGYYYPTARADVLLVSGPAIPVLGDVARYTVSPIIGRLLWRKALARIFGPNHVPRKFAGFPKEMALRPSQIRAAAEETAITIPQAMRLRRGYRGLTMPVVIVAGGADRIVDFGRQSARLHAELPGSELMCVAQNGHMVHQTATDWVAQAIELAGRGPDAARSPAEAPASERTAPDAPAPGTMSGNG